MDSDIQLNILLTPYLCYISFLYLSCEPNILIHIRNKGEFNTIN